MPNFQGSDVLALAFRPDSKELCSSALDGQLYFWDSYNGTLKFTIEGRKDILGGRRADDARAAKNSTHSLAFTRYTTLAGLSFCPGHCSSLADDNLT